MRRQTGCETRVTEEEMNRGILLCRHVKELSDKLEKQKSKLVKLEAYITMVDDMSEKDFKDVDVYVKIYHASIDFTTDRDVQEFGCNASTVIRKTLASMRQEIEARIEDTIQDIQTCLNSMPGVSKENV